MSTSAQENLLRRYLLGALPDAEAVALEAEYFSDTEKFEQIWAQENELVDEYMRGRLGSEERRLFERNYLSSPPHQARVLTAQKLLAVADAQLVAAQSADAPVTSATQNVWQQLQNFFRLPQFVWAGALLVLAVLGGWRLFQLVSKQSPKIATASPSPSHDTTPSATPSSPAVTPSPTNSPTPIAPKVSQPAPAMLAFTLLNPVVRGNDKIQRLVIPTETRHVRLQVKLPDEEYPRYQVTLRSAKGNDLLTHAIPKPASGNQVVTVTIPTPKIPPGDYFLVLSGLGQDNEAEELVTYFFRVTRK